MCIKKNDPVDFPPHHSVFSLSKQYLVVFVSVNEVVEVCMFKGVLFTLYRDVALGTATATCQT